MVKKWTIEKPPEGYPRKCKRDDLSDAVKDFSDEFLEKCINDNKDFFNKGWKDRSLAFIQLGQTELQRRNNVLMLWIAGITLLVSLIAVCVSLS